MLLKGLQQATVSKVNHFIKDKFEYNSKQWYTLKKKNIWGLRLNWRTKVVDLK